MWAVMSNKAWWSIRRQLVQPPSLLKWLLSSDYALFICNYLIKDLFIYFFKFHYLVSFIYLSLVKSKKSAFVAPKKINHLFSKSSLVTLGDTTMHYLSWALITWVVAWRRIPCSMEPFTESSQMCRLSFWDITSPFSPQLKYNVKSHSWSMPLSLVANHAI